MRRIAIAYISSLAIFVAIDFIWLSVMADRVYRPVMGDMLLNDFKLAPAITFYLLYVAGTVFLATYPGLRAHSCAKAMLNGAVLGFTAYATYDLTNQSTLKNWSMTLTVSDVIWGTFLTAIAAAGGCMIAGRLGNHENAFSDEGR